MAALIAFEDIVSIFGDVLLTSEEQASLAELSAQAEADWQTRSDRDWETISSNAINAAMY